MTFESVLGRYERILAKATFVTSQGKQRAAGARWFVRGNGLYVAVALILGASACSSESPPASGGFGNLGTGGGSGGSGVASGGVNIGTAGTPTAGTASASGGGTGIVVGGDCKNLQCQQKTCAGGTTTTTISGKVYDPSGTLPLYNVMVYVPNAPLTPLKAGANCLCEVNGEPMAAGLTDTNGNFVVNNVPVGANIPLVIQVGKWRRQFTIPSVGECTNTAVPDGTLRLPARQSEGDMPKVALTTGAADALECLIRKLGIDPAEITNPDGVGRFNYFSGHDGANKYAPSVNAGAAFPMASSLWNTTATLQPYDIVLLSCEGAPYPEEKAAAAFKAMADYANLGGRVFMSHWHQVWLTSGPYPTVARYTTSQSDIGNATAGVVTTFPKGQALSEWLVNVQGSITPGQINITNAQYTIVTENPLYAQRWIASAMPPSVQYLSANTPIGVDPAMQCGRIVLSDLHVAGGASLGGGTDSSSPSVPFPMGCVTTGLSPQEKVLAFMLFDISACLIPDTKKPEPPVVK